MNIKILAYTALTLLTSACGGGGGSEDGSNKGKETEEVIVNQQGTIAISGALEFGANLEAKITDPDGITNISNATYQWQRNAVDIAGANSNSYTLTMADFNQVLNIKVTYVDDKGFSNSLTSLQTAKVPAIDFIGTLSIKGKAEQGQTLNVELLDDNGIDLNQAIFTWFTDDSVINGQTKQALTLTPELVGKTISVQVNYTDQHGFNDTLTALQTIAVAPSSEPLQHPIIYTTDSERSLMLEKIEKYDWAQNVFQHLKQTVDAKIAIHSANPEAIINAIPELASDSHGSGGADKAASLHQEVLATARNAATLYYLTRETKYAKYGADIFQAYIERLGPLSPQTTSISGDVFYDARAGYPALALTYDFLYHYLNSSGTKVYSKKKDTNIPFDNDLAQKAMTNMVGNVLQEYGKPDRHGRVVSNHPILTATGALYTILCIDDQDERNRLFEVFWETGTFHQSSFTKTILPIFGEQGIWPESLSYSFMGNISQILNIVDRIYPEMDVTQEYKNILEGNFLFDYLRSPNRIFVRFGDSKRYNDSTGQLYLYTLDIAKRKGYTELAQKAQLALKQASDAKGGQLPTLKESTFGTDHSLKLFWGQPLSEQLEGSIDFEKPTVIIEHAGVALQRNSVANNNVDYGLTGIIGGAHYVHSHATGISMELYGANYFMAANGGMPVSVADRKLPEHAEYFRLYAGNNTVVVNGTSHGKQPGSWTSNGYLWQDTSKNIAAEPAHLQDPINPNYSFATQRLDDTVNNAEQERTLGIIRTSEKTAFYFDMFRSRSLGDNKFHDYIYHNIGDETVISDHTGELSLTSTDRYDNDIDDPVGSPGWRFFEQEQVTAPTTSAVNIQFKLHHNQRSMNLFVPDGVEREYTYALAPATREAKNGYVKKKTQTIAIRQQGEAWERPFIAVLEPSTTYQSSVTSVTQLSQDGRVVGAKVVSNVNGNEIINYIINHDDPKATYNNNALGLSFTGRYAVVTDRGGDDVELYIGEGTQLQYGKHHASAGSSD
ncbi:hypothetical protein [Catenovulum maritimum]|uniref:Uncharacterized protein n=1 Tax=Catenovulum maritimum TaxID=1513271 RepID=A0A0J8GW96_9ALTE|nr:hypothetical protein [Catenovulum maritimum]KMT67040.1 hypothetical protein XM47_00075 [Catenovulum maritimum]